MSKKKKNNWGLFYPNNDKFVLFDLKGSSLQGAKILEVALFCSVETGEMKMFNIIDVNRRGTDAILKELNQE